jgi:hypothetical protein
MVAVGSERLGTLVARSWLSQVSRGKLVSGVSRDELLGVSGKMVTGLIFPEEDKGKDEGF